MNMQGILEVIKGFDHVAMVEIIRLKIRVRLHKGFTFKDGGAGSRSFDNASEAILGVNLAHINLPPTTGLVNGKIQANMVCPFKDKCIFAKTTCGHLGVDHDVPYSCGFARLYNIDSRN